MSEIVIEIRVLNLTKPYVYHLMSFYATFSSSIWRFSLIREVPFLLKRSILIFMVTYVKYNKKECLEGKLRKGGYKMSIQLKEVNNENWEECVELKVHEEQNEYVPSNAYSIAQSKFEDNMYLFAIYNGDCMVGFTSYILDDDGDMNLARFMIDKNYQGKGYGKLALKEVIELIKNNFDNKEVWMSIHPKNTTGIKLYIGAGFKVTETGFESEDEVFLKLDFK